MKDNNIETILAFIKALLTLVFSIALWTISGYESIKAILSIVQTQTVTYWNAFWIMLTLSMLLYNNKQNKNKGDNK